jgi:hypothetical protein
MNSASGVSTALDHIESTFEEFDSEEPFTYQFVYSRTATKARVSEDDNYS